MATRTFTFDVRVNAGEAKRVLGQLSGELDKLEKAKVGDNLSAVGDDLFNAARRAAGGILDLTRSASKLQESQNFVQQVFGDAAEAIFAYAEGASKSALVSEQAALQGAASLGVFGQKAGLVGADLANFSTQLVDLAGDMASLANTSVEDAIVAIAAAMRNEYEPIRKYSAVINEVTLEKEYARVTGRKLEGQLTQEQKILAVNSQLFQDLSFAVGDVDRTFGTFANQSRLLDANIENLKANLGDAFLPVMTELATAANAAAEGLIAIPDPVKELGARATVAGVGIAGVAGSFAILATQGPKVATRVRNIRSSFNEAATAGTKFQRSTALAAKGVTRLGLAFAGLDLGFNIGRELSDQAEKLQSAFADFQAAQAARDVDELASAFANLANNQDLSFVESVKEAFSGMRVELDGSTISTVEFNKAVEQIGSTGTLPEQIAALEQLRDVLVDNRFEWSRSAETSEEANEINAFVTLGIKHINEQLRIRANLFGSDAEAAQHDAEALVNNADAAIVAQVENEKLKTKLRDTNKAFDEQAEFVNETAKSFADIQAEYSSIEARVGAFAEALDQVTRNDRKQNLGDIAEATRNIFDAFRDEDDNIQVTADKFNILTDAGYEVNDAVSQLASDWKAELVRVFEESDGDINVVNLRLRSLIEQLKNNAREAGFTEEEVESLVDMMETVPEDIETAMKLTGDALARQKIAQLNIDIASLPEEVRSEYVAAVERGDAQAAWSLLQQYLTDQGALKQNVYIPVDRRMVSGYVSAIQSIMNANPVYQRIKLLYPKGSNYGYYQPPSYIGSGLQSAESRAAAPRPEGGYVGYAGGPMTRAGGQAGLPVARGAVSMLPDLNVGVRDLPSQVNIRMPVGTDERRVVDLLRKYTRRSGSLQLGEMTSAVATRF